MVFRLWNRSECLVNCWSVATITKRTCFSTTVDLATMEKKNWSRYNDENIHVIRISFCFVVVSWYIYPTLTFSLYDVLSPHLFPTLYIRFFFVSLYNYLWISISHSITLCEHLRLSTCPIYLSVRPRSVFLLDPSILQYWFIYCLTLGQYQSSISTI